MILTLTMALSLVACGNKEEKTVSTDGSTSMQKVINANGYVSLSSVKDNREGNQRRWCRSQPKDKRTEDYITGRFG